MTTVLLRAATLPVADSTAGTMLAQIANELTGASLTVSPERYDIAEQEMTELQRRRGYSEIARAQMPEKNFMFYGVAIVRGD